MVVVRLQSDHRRLIRHLQKAGSKVGKRALKRALTDVGKQAFTKTKKGVADKMGVAQKRITNKRTRQLWLTLPYRRGSDFVWETSIRASGRPLPLSYFKGTAQRKSGVTSLAYGKRTLYAKAFLATMGSGHRGAYVRKKGASTQPVRVFPKSSQASKVMSGKLAGKEARTALPIKELFGPSVPGTLALPLFAKMVQETVAQRFPRLLNAALDYEMRKTAGAR